jgi:hypothetical protein
MKTPTRVSLAKAEVHAAVAHVAEPTQLRKKSGAADKWVPAFAGKASDSKSRLSLT